MQTTGVQDLGRVVYEGKMYKLKQMVASTLSTAIIQAVPPSGHRLVFQIITATYAAGIRPNFTASLKSGPGGADVVPTFASHSGSGTAAQEQWGLQYTFHGPIILDVDDGLEANFSVAGSLVGFHGQYIEVPV